MKKTIAIISVSIFLLLFIQPAVAQLYWDTNGITAGAGGATPTGIWGTDAFWGNALGDGATGAWADGNTAYFAAGTDASGTYTVTVSGTQTPAGINFEEGTVTLSGGTFNFSGSAAVDVASGLTATIDSVLTGSALLSKSGLGTLVLSGNSSASGLFTVGGGTVQMGASGNILPSAPVSVSSGATFDLNGFSVGVGSWGGAGSVTLGSGTLTNLGVGASSFTGTITGGGNVVKAGANTMTFNPASAASFTGKAIITGGTLAINLDTRLGAVPGSIVPDQITLNGGTLQLTATAVIIHTNRGITLGASGGIIAVSSSQAPVISANITGLGDLSKGNSGTVDLNGTNTFSGNFVITGGGVRFNSSLPAGTGTIIVSPVSLVTLRNLNSVAFPVTSSTVTNAITLSANGGIDIDLTAATGNTFTLSGPISGFGYMTRGRATGAAGNSVLSGDNSGWSGGLVYIRGTVTLGHRNALGTGTTTITPAGGNDVFVRASVPLTEANAVGVPINIAITNNAHVTFSGNNALEFSGPVNLGPTVTPNFTNINTGGVTLSGVISGGAGVGFNKYGTNTLTLSGANTYSGPTTVNAGTLLVNSVGGTSTGTVTVNSTATLGGTGTVFGAVSVVSEATIGAGASAGSLTLTNGLNLSSGGTNVWELAVNSDSNPGVDFDQIVLTGGNLALGGSSRLMIKFIGSATSPLSSEPFWQANHTWKIIALSGSAANPGSTTFTTLLGTNGITAGTFSASVDAAGVYLNYTASAVALPQPTITSAVLSGGIVSLQGTNGAASGSYAVLTSTNVTLPLASWTTNTTGAFSGAGAFSNGIPFNVYEPQRFFRIKQP